MIRRNTALLPLLLLAPALAPAAEFELTWTGDFPLAVDGGLGGDARPLGLVDVAAGVDLPAVAGAGTTAFVRVEQAYGGGLSEQAIGDLQAVSNIDAPPGTYLVELWVDLEFASGLGIRAGRYDLNSEFDSMDASGLFLSGAQGMGLDFGQSGASGPSVYPDTAFGLRVQQGYGETGVVKAAVADVSSTVAHSPADAPFASGPLLVLESGVDGFGAHWHVGAWAYCDEHEEIGHPDRKTREYGGYGSVERSFGPVSAYLRAGIANAEVDPIAGFVSAGLVLTGGLFQSVEDQLGLAVGHARPGDDAAAPANGDPPMDSTETVIELTWRVTLRERYSIQPDLQYIVDPGASRSTPNAWYFGVRLEASFTGDTKRDGS